MKKILMMIAVALSMATAYAKTIVVDTEGEPMVGAVVMDNEGAPIGIIDREGVMPPVRQALYPLVINFMGFERAIVLEPTDTVVMQPAKVQLNEVQVNRGDRPGMYVVCYVRETSGMTDGVDSMCVSSQYMVDYMLPAYKGAKCKTWDKARTLAESRDIRYTTEKGPDKGDLNLMSWYKDLVSLSNRPAEVPEALKGKTHGTEKITTKEGVAQIHRMTPEAYYVTYGEMADSTERRISVPFMALLGLSMDIVGMGAQRNYAYSEDGVYNLKNLTGLSCSLKIEGKGKSWNKLMPFNHLPVKVYTYIEVYPVEIAFLTKDEVKDIKKNKPVRPLTPPNE